MNCPGIMDTYVDSIVRGPRAMVNTFTKRSFWSSLQQHKVVVNFLDITLSRNMGQT